MCVGGGGSIPCPKINVEISALKNNPKKIMCPFLHSGNLLKLDSKTGHIYLDSKTGHIYLDSKTGHIYLDSKTGHIYLDSKTGHIYLDSKTGHIYLFGQ